MSDRPFWEVMLQWTLWGAIMGVFFYFTSKAARKAAEATPEDGWHRVPKWSAWIGAPMALFGALFGVAGIVWVPQSPTGGTGVAAGFVAMGLACLVTGIWMIRAPYREGVKLEGDGLVSIGPFGRRKISYSDLKSVKFGHASKWFIFKVDGERSIRLYAMTVGIVAFCQALAERAPHLKQSECEIWRNALNGETPPFM